VVVGGPVGIGICNLISSLDITNSGLKGIRPIPLKPPLLFFSVIAVKWVALKVRKNSTLVI
jgi:hypothetical protein